ncbi:hypothetical protein GJ744_006164 [Endocarpon pusillum]|uniref:Uncharacterized protein n=1 Tax=Endocarpon pusillum TaxID=364733 RepID=A0A8H7DYE4_9EURO|nr:hypothetical protein GJ744_006164 [Endocarpon pusillum]
MKVCCIDSHQGTCAKPSLKLVSWNAGEAEESSQSKDTYIMIITSTMCGSKPTSCPFGGVVDVSLFSKWKGNWLPNDSC